MTVPTFATDDPLGDCGKPERFHLLPDSCLQSDPAGLRHPSSMPVSQELRPLLAGIGGIDITFIKEILPFITG